MERRLCVVAGSVGGAWQDVGQWVGCVAQTSGRGAWGSVSVGREAAAAVGRGREAAAGAPTCPAIVSRPPGLLPRTYILSPVAILKNYKKRFLAVLKAG